MLTQRYHGETMKRPDGSLPSPIAPNVPLITTRSARVDALYLPPHLQQAVIGAGREPQRSSRPAIPGK
jgi:hypothetical protein